MDLGEEAVTIRKVAFVLFLAVGLSLLRWKQIQASRSVVSGILETEQARLGSRVGGRVKAVRLREGNPVRVGQEIVLLEAPDLVAKLEQARADVKALEAVAKRLSSGFRPEEIAQAKAARDQAQAALDEAVAGPRPQEILVAREALAQARAELELAQATCRRNKALVDGRVLSPDRWDELVRGARVSEAVVRARTADLAVLLEGTRAERIVQARGRLAESQALLDLRVRGFRKEEVDEASARLDVARRAFSVLDEQVKELSIRATLDGRIEELDLEPGDLVSAGVPVVTLASDERLWMRSYVPQGRLDVVRPGVHLPVVFDAFPGKVYQGTVSFVAIQGEFSPSNAQTPDERSRQAHRFKLDLKVREELRPGMSGIILLDLPAK